MVFTHRITDDTGTLSMRLVRTVIQLDHRIQNPALHRLQSISDIRQSPGGNYAHRIIDIGFLHRFLQIYFPDLVKYFVVHIMLRFSFFRIATLYIQISDARRVFLDELSSRLNLVSHQCRKCHIDG